MILGSVVNCVACFMVLHSARVSYCLHVIGGLTGVAEVRAKQHCWRATVTARCAGRLFRHQFGLGPDDRSVCRVLSRWCLLAKFCSIYAQ